MPKSLTIAECEALGMKFPASQMDNGEYRFRVMGPDNSGYIRTVMPANNCGWNNAHYHKGIVETVIVQRGWVGIAKLLLDRKFSIAVLRESNIWVSHPGEAYNIYMSAGTTLHTVKYGAYVGNPAKNGADWYEAPPDFDTWSKSLTEADIFRLAGLSSEEIKRSVA